MEKTTSPILNKTVLVGDRYPILDIECPICKALLVAVSEYDFKNYDCFVCGANYPYGETNLENLREDAKKYLALLQKKVDGRKQEISNLEKILAAGKKSDLIE